MKTEPTDLDREAAQLFVPAPGIRLLTKDGSALRVVVNTDGDLWTCCECCVVPDTLQLDLDDVHAIDADDPATVGCMLAQVQDERPNRCVSLADRLHELPEAPDRRFMALVGHEGAFAGPTRGFVLVSVMRTLRASPPPGKLPNGGSEPR